MVTLKQIAAECGVSVASVSKALNHMPDIGPKTAERIRQKAQDMGYHPNAAARALKTNRAYSIGLLYDDITGPGLTHEYYAGLLNAVKQQVESAGYTVTFINNSIGGRKSTYLEHCQHRSCNGVVVVNKDFSDPGVVELANSNLPVVTVDFMFNSCSAVVSDNIQGVRDIMEYVCKKGHRRIAFIHGEDTAVTRARLASFHQFCMEQGLSIPDEYLVAARYHDPDRCRVAAKQLLDLKERPTCILCPDDISALGAIAEIEQAGLSIPSDISIVGYDGIPLTRIFHPYMTTICQDSQALGTTAAKLLLDCIENPKTFIPRIVTIPGKLQPGETVAEISAD